MLRVSYLFQGSDEDRDAYVRETFAPMLRELPDVRRVDLWRVTEVAVGEVRARFIIDAWFDDEHAMHAAFSSAEGREVAREIIAVEGKGMEMIAAESME